MFTLARVWLSPVTFPAVTQIMHRRSEPGALRGTAPNARPADVALAAGVLALLALHALLAWWARAPGVLTEADDATYILLAESLRSFAYHDLFEVGEPSHRQYPPGYPALLLLWGTAFGERFDTFVMLGIAASTAALGLVFSALRRLWSTTAALLCLAPLVVNPYLITQAGKVASEAPYIFFSVLALWALARKETSPRWLILAGSAAVAAALTRSIGVTLLLAVGLHWLTERRWRLAALFVGTCAASVGLWLLWTALAPERYPGSSYVADAGYRGPHQERSLVSVLLVRMVRYIPGYLGVILPQRLPLPGSGGMLIDNVLGALIVAAGVGIGFFAFYRRWRVAVFYLLAYVLLLVLWPWQLSRFVDPILPVLVPVVLLGVGELAARMKARWRMPAMALLALTMTVVGCSRTAELLRANAECERGLAWPPPACLRSDQQSFFAAAEYIRERTPRSAALVASKAAPLYYYTGRQSVALEPLVTGPPEHFVAEAQRAGAEYILLGTLHTLEVGGLAEVVEASCEELAFEAHFPPRTYLLRFRGDGEVVAGNAACEAVAEYRRRNADRDFARDP